MKLNINYPHVWLIAVTAASAPLKYKHDVPVLIIAIVWSVSMPENLIFLNKIYWNCGFNIQISPSVSIGLGNGLAPNGDKSLPNPMMIKTQPAGR